MENVKKCKNFLSTLINLAGSQPVETVKSVKELIQGLIDGKIQPEKFTEQLLIELKSSPQPDLVPFLKKSLPLLRQSLLTGAVAIEGVRPPPANAVGPIPGQMTTVASSMAGVNKHKRRKTTAGVSVMANQMARAPGQPHPVILQNSSGVSGTLGLVPSAPQSTSFNPLTAPRVHSSTKPGTSGTCAPSISGGTTNVSILECAICMTNTRDIVFNCGHLACSECAEKLSLCHMCRVTITDKKKIFF